MKAKSAFLAENALASPTLVHGSSHGEGPNLPMPVLWRQSQLNEPAIGWMSAKSVLGA